MAVWVVAASKHGSTREVAEAIAEEIGQARDVELLDAGAIESFDGADAVVLGSAIYADSWLDPAWALLEERAEELSRRPTWLFSVGPIGEPPEREEDYGPIGIEEARKAAGARGHEVFAGKLDREVLGRMERVLVTALRAPQGDFRDWSAIRAWARSIAAELSASIS